MKNKISIMLLLVSFVVSSINAQMTSEERKFAIKYLNDTKNDLLKAIKGLSNEQLNFKPNAESWSIDECIRHITLSEQNIWAGFVDAALVTDPDPSKRSEVRMSDEQLMGVIESREQKVKTFAPFEPGNMTGDLKSVLKKFKSLRGSHIQFTKESNDDLRNRYGQLPFGTIDAYQAILFMSGHTKRHTDQIREVMASANFPY